jgi:hypothetical protein
MRTVSVDLEVADQQLIRYSVFVRRWRKSGTIITKYISYLQILRRHKSQSGDKYTMFSMHLVYL